MNNIKTKFIAVMLIVALALTGCAKMDVGLVIHSDGSGKLTTTATIDKQAYIDYMKELYKSMGMEITETELKELDTTMKEGGYSLVTIDGKEYYQMTESDNIQKGGLQKYFGGDDASYVTTDTVYLTMAMGINEDLKEMQEQAKASGVELSSDSITFTMTVEMPNPIVTTNGTIDASNPNKASFNIPLDKNSTIFATTKKGVTVDSVKATIKKLNTVKATKITKLKANKVKSTDKKATVTLKFKKVKGIKKYQVQYSTKKNFKVKKSKMTQKNTYTIKKLKKGTKYYVRVRAVKTNYAGQTVYSQWVKKSVKTKK